jgi:predicted O-methyltransferase YrrM
MTDWIESIPSAVKGHRFFLEWLVRPIRSCETIVELGVDYGYSAFVFEKQLALNRNHHSKIYGIDWFRGDASTGYRDTEDLVKAAIDEHSLKYIEIIKGNFTDIAKVWSKPIDILFIDGSHDYESVKQDLYNWCKFVKPDGLILMHDTNVPDFGVRRVFEEAKGYCRAEFKHSAGLGILTRSHKVHDELLRVFEHYPEPLLPYPNEN